MEYTVTIQDKTLHLQQSASTFKVDGVEMADKDFLWIKEGQSAMIKIQHQHYRINIIKMEGKMLMLTINGKQTEVNIADSMDILLQELGMDKMFQKGVEDLKSPMPGLVLKVMTQVGEVVKKGSPLIILEAMKMENVIKAPSDVVIKEILVKEKDAIEKNKVMIRFE
jgi:biotin carboxyl carrier protein